MEWINELEKQNGHNNETFSFNDYMEIVENNPKGEVRTNSLYLKDMFDFYGQNEQGGFKFFEANWPDAPPVFGQQQTQQEIYQNLKNFIDEGFNNRFLLLVGPNGSAKTSLIHKIMKACEFYSQTDEGALYSFSWVFPVDNYVKGALGIGQNQKSRGLDSYANLEDKDISAILGSELKDHPLLLIPLKARQALLEKFLKDRPDQWESIRNSYLYNGDISKKNRMIYDALLKNYHGDYTEVLKHIRVERFYINRRYSVGSVTIGPQLHVDANLQQITMDKRLGSLPPSLQSLNLFNLNGEVVLANRGILEFSDLLKRPLDAFKYLLTTVESRTVNLKGILTELDILFIGTSNEVHLAAFRQHPDFASFKGRFKFLRVPYLLSYKDEEKIYAEQVKQLHNICHFSPHTVEYLSKFSVMTRLRPGKGGNLKNPKARDLVATLNPLEKANFLATQRVPDRIDSEGKQILRNHYKEIRQEFDGDTLYEGKFGVSPREVKQVIYEIAGRFKFVTVIELMDYLNEFITRKNEHDFLNIATQGDYNNPGKFIELLEQDYLDVFDNEVRESLGLVDERSYEDYLARYVLNINALLKNETIKNPITGKFEPADMYFIKEFENNISLKEGPEQFRSHMISTLGAYYLDNPNQDIVYSDVFSDLVDNLQDSFRQEQKKIIDVMVSPW